MRKDNKDIDEEILIESPTYNDKEVPKILLTHPPPSSRKALPPIRTFQMGLKDVNIVPPLLKKLPPVPDEIKLPHSMRREVVGGSGGPNVISEPVPSTSGATSNETATTEGRSDDAFTHVSDSTSGPRVPAQIPDGTEQLREASSIASPTTVIMTNEAKQSKSDDKKTAPKSAIVGKPNKSAGRLPRKPNTSNMSRLARPKTVVAKKPNLKSASAQKASSSKQSTNIQTPSLKPEGSGLPVPETTDKVTKELQVVLTDQKDEPSANEKTFFESTKVPEIVKATQDAKTDTEIQALDTGLSLENDLTIVSTVNEDFSSSNNTDILHDSYEHDNEPIILVSENQSTEKEKGLSTQNGITQDTSEASQADKYGISAESKVSADEVSPSSGRVPSPESTASIASNVVPTMTAVESVMPAESSIIANGIKNMSGERHVDDTDYSADSFSSDSDEDLPITKPHKKPQPFLLETEITHVPLSHPITPFIRDIESRVDTKSPTRKMGSAATQKRAMSSRLLTSSYGTRPNVPVQAYNPLEDAKHRDSGEHEKKKAQVAAEKADAKKKGAKRLKAMNNVYGNIKKPPRR